MSSDTVRADPVMIIETFFLILALAVLYGYYRLAARIAKLEKRVRALEGHTHHLEGG